MGVLLLIVGLAVLGFGLFQHVKGKRILAAPFKKTGELAKNPISEDPKGAMSTEGLVVAPSTPLLSPCTQVACLAYELKIERLYEKTETTQDGTKTVKGSETLETIKGGTIFGLDDGSGVFNVDVSKGADFDNMKDGFKKELNGSTWSSRIHFGEYAYDVPAIGGSDKGWTTGFKATEKYVPVEGSLFVLGKLEGGALVKPGWRSLMTSAKGRDGLLGSVQKKKKFSFIGGGVAAVLSIPLMIFAPKADPNAISAYCESTLTDARQRCQDTAVGESGETYTWNVTKAGTYEVTAFAPKKKVPFMPQVIVSTAEGDELANDTRGVGLDAVATVEVKAGSYRINVKPGDGYTVKGGFTFDLQVKSMGVEAAPAVASAKASGEKLDETVARLNELCGDVWCEGQFNYTFTSLKCADATHCTVAFTAKDSSAPKKKAITAEVEVAGFTALESDEYVGSFDEKLTDALGNWEMNPIAASAKKTAAPVVAVKPAPAPAPVVKPAPAPAPVAVKTAPAPAPVAVAAPAPAPAPVKHAEIAKPAPAPAPVKIAAAPVEKKAAPAAKKQTASAPTTVRSSSKNLED